MHVFKQINVNMLQQINLNSIITLLKYPCHVMYKIKNIFEINSLFFHLKTKIKIDVFV